MMAPSKLSKIRTYFKFDHKTNVSVCLVNKDDDFELNDGIVTDDNDPLRCGKELKVSITENRNTEAKYKFQISISSSFISSEVYFKCCTYLQDDKASNLKSHLRKKHRQLCVQDTLKNSWSEQVTEGYVEVIKEARKVVKESST